MRCGDQPYLLTPENYKLVQTTPWTARLWKHTFVSRTNHYNHSLEKPEVLKNCRTRGQFSSFMSWKPSVLLFLWSCSETGGLLNHSIAVNNATLAKTMLLPPEWAQGCFADGAPSGKAFGDYHPLGKNLWKNDTGDPSSCFRPSWFSLCLLLW